MVSRCVRGLGRSSGLKPSGTRQALPERCTGWCRDRIGGEPLGMALLAAAASYACTAWFSGAVVERRKPKPLSLPQITRTGINTCMSRPLSRSHPLLAFTFAASLLFAQWLLVQHGANLEQHASSHACEWCLTHAPLHGALTLTTPSVFPTLAPFLQRVPHSTFLAGELLPAYASRAPPRSFPV